MDFLANPLHLVLLLVVILIIFGAGKLPSVGSALGQSIKEFKKATNDEEEKRLATPALGMPCAKCQTTNALGAQFCTGCGAPMLPQVATNGVNEVFCSQCGTKNSGVGRFCVQCGAGLNVTAG